MNPLRFLVPVVLLSVACGSTKPTPTSSRQPPREPDCDIEVLTALPRGDYVEVGTVDVNPGGYGHNVHTDLESFKREIQPHVCALGGDTAIALANGMGMWIKATVLKRMSAEPQESANASPEPRGVGAAPSGAIGCSYDTQCKGDRICQSGQCVDPVVSQ